MVIDIATRQGLATNFRGELLGSSDEGYEEARKIWNGAIDRRPALIARSTCAEDVIAAVKFARQNRLLVSVRGGGHSVAGHSVSEGGLMIDLSLMKGIEIDPEGRTARAQPGLSLGEFDRATQQHGLAVPAGQVSTTGIAGLTLGGGTGWLMRKYGLTIDNLLSVELVTADGTLLNASEIENPELFWGMRGAGANFGIVTSFEYRLQPVGPMVLGGFLIYPVERIKEALRFSRDFMAQAPDELTTFNVLFTAPPQSPFPAHLQGWPVLAVAPVYAGPIEEGERVIRPLREFGPPELDLVGPMSYTALQSMLDETAPAGLHHYNKAHYLQKPTDEAIQTLIERFVTAPSPMAQVLLTRMGGAVARVAEEATAFGHRDAPYLLWIINMWADSAEADPNVAWTRGTWEAMLPWGTGGTYVNALGDEGHERVRSAYGAANYERLVALKNKYDPTNFFRLNQNITPTACGC
jgi:FAD/FMN-containing dehydrogenase